MIEKKKMTAYDFLVFIVLLLVLGIGLLSIYSATQLHLLPRGRTPLYLKQLYWIFLGSIALVVFASIDYHDIARWAYPLYGITVFFLVMVLIGGQVIQGAKRWISLGLFSFQPSELTKIALLLVSAKYLSDFHPKGNLNLKQLFIPGILMLIPLLLILKQPDLGTALAISSLFFSMIFVLGLKSKLLIYASLLLAMLFPFMWQFFWNHLKGYQRERVLTFFDPTGDPMGRGYHIIQSKIAVGSGGFFGKGFLGGTQSQLKFLPEGHTDFIFSVYSEEWGFVGILFLFLLFFFLVLWGVDVAVKAKDVLGTLIASGVVGLISFYFLLNVAMTLGMMPVVGVPLPLISYGGTSIVVTMALLGLLVNVKLRRFMLFY